MNQAETLLRIEKLMHSVLTKVYDWESFIDDFQNMLRAAESVYQPELEYSPLIQAYFDLMLANLGFDDNDLFYQYQAFKSFQRRLAEQQQDFLAEFEAKNKRNQRSLFEYFASLLQQHRKLLLVRVDLSYKFDHVPTIKQFDQDIKRLTRRIQDKDTIFKGQVGYVYRLEQGVKSKGFHCHLLVIYNGSKHCSDGYLGQCIGELWQEQITSGDGQFFNCNQKAHKQKYQQSKQLGIGMIERDDGYAISNAKEAMRYLALPEKDDQYLRCRLAGMRAFSKGQFKRK